MGKTMQSRGVPFAILSIIFLTYGIIYINFLYPVAASGPEQPIPFSHRLHVDIKEMDCMFCHNTVERTRFAGMPSVDKCLFCHEFIINEHPVIKELQGYADREEPIPWNKVTWLPDHVYFSHERHIKGGISCIECHGDVQRMDRVQEFWPDALNNMVDLGSPFKMGFCLDCHQQQVVAEPVDFNIMRDARLVEVDGKTMRLQSRAPTDCWTCHQ